MAEADLLKIVGMIMENPKLVEEIKSLGTKEEKENADVDVKVEASGEAVPTATVESPTASRIKRRDLLSALKPYVSEGRGRAIESMMSIGDILEMMRSK